VRLPPRKFLTLNFAIAELTVGWKIPLPIAEQIVRGVLLGGKCFARGKDRSGVLRDSSGVLRDISKEIGPTLWPNLLLSREFDDVEIDRSDLLEHGRKLVPTEYEGTVSAAEARSAEDRSADDRELTPTAAAETAMRKWLSEQLDDPPGRKEDIFKWATSGELIGEVGKSLGRKSFNRAWHENAPPSWKLPGERPRCLQLSDIKSRNNQIRSEPHDDQGP
jgi:hypothetical protein